MSDAASILVAEIGGVATVLAATITTVGVVLYKRLGHIKRATDATVEQVANDHKDDDGNPINFRDEQDERHRENSEKIDGLIGKVDGLVVDVAALRAADEDHDERLEQIEHTWPRSSYAPRARHREETS